MQYRPEDFIHLRLVTNPDSDFGFDVIDAATGRPVAGIIDVAVQRGVRQEPPYNPTPQKVTVTFAGIPVDLNFPDWTTFVRQRQAAHDQARLAAENAGRREDGPAVPPPPEAAPEPFNPVA